MLRLALLAVQASGDRGAAPRLPNQAAFSRASARVAPKVIWAPGMVLMSSRGRPAASSRPAISLTNANANANAASKSPSPGVGAAALFRVSVLFRQVLTLSFV
jgi:hypothetical protein